MKYSAVGALAGVLAFFSAGNVDASNGFYKPIRCDTCVTENDFYAQAINAGNGHFLVYNLPAGTMQYWHIPSDPTPGNPGRPDRPMSIGVLSGQSGTKRIPPAEATQELRIATQAYSYGKNTLRPIYVVPVERLTQYPHVRDSTVHDLVRDKNMQRMLETATGDTATLAAAVDPNFLERLVEMGQVAVSYLKLKEQTAAIIKVVFKDGSYAYFKATVNNPNGEYQADSPRTAGDQYVPSDIAEVEGTWSSHGGDNLDRMAQHFRDLGAQIVNLGPQTGSANTISCTGAGQNRTCRVVRVIW
ncbi:hypothetical protein [Luteimonas sp. TWI1416]|uniref:hypothetical protein n=1 Tax=unclassified Luteimonas TaxID=2629088 RepID=UPI00320AC37E